MTSLSLDDAQRNLPEIAQKALQGEEVTINVGNRVLRLVQEVAIRPPGYFASCYEDREDAKFEERICRDSHPIIEE